jgi:hypothetical protein
MKDPLDSGHNLRFWQHLLIYLFACAVIVTRRPDAILHAQFWAEDGHVWFADAYNYGWWVPLFHTQDGYLQILPRLAASVALLVPIYLAPLVMNLVAIAVQALPVNILLSSRSVAWGTLRFRALLAALYLVLPNSRELSAVVTQSQWVLTLCVFLLLVTPAPRGAIRRSIDVFLLLLCGLTGPFCIFLFPIALLLAFKKPDPWRWVQTALLAALCGLQALCLLVLDSSVRPHFPLGASPAMFLRLLGGHVYLGALLGANGAAALPGSGIFIFLACMALAGTAVIYYGFSASVFEMKLFLVLSGLLFVASLHSPSAYPPAGVSVWQLMAGVGGIRYWFFPTLAFVWSLPWCYRSLRAGPRILAAFFLVALCFGVARDWRLPAFQDHHFTEDAKRFASAPAGTAVTFQLNPTGWQMRLVKRAPGIGIGGVTWGVTSLARNGTITMHCLSANLYNGRQQNVAPVGRVDCIQQLCAGGEKWLPWAPGKG